MLHSGTTPATIEAIEADGRGSIAGFRVTCAACGFTFTSSLRGIAERDAWEHVDYMLRREAQGFRRAGLDGWGAR